MKMSYTDTELDEKAKTIQQVWSGPGDSSLRELVELGSLEAATGHPENQMHTDTPDETRQDFYRITTGRERDNIQRMTHNTATENSKHSRCK